MTRPRKQEGEPDVSIIVCPNGPLLVHGDVALVGEDGEPIGARTPMVLCRCGRSATKPFCDASHKLGKKFRA